MVHRSQVPVRSACEQAWDAMRGGARRRFCEACQHDVVNLSALTEKEAAETLAQAGATRLCVRYEADREGRIHFRAEPREPAAGLRAHVAAGALAALTRTAAPLIPASALLSACVEATPVPPAPPPAPVSPAPPPQASATASSTADPTLGSAGAVVVHVEDLAQHAPLQDAVVIVSSAALKIEQVAITEKDGRAAFKDLPPGKDYAIRIDLYDHRPYQHPIEVSAGHVERLEVGLVVEPMTVIMGELPAQSIRVVDTSTPQNVKLDPNFVSRLPLR